MTWQVVQLGAVVAGRTKHACAAVDHAGTVAAMRRPLTGCSKLQWSLMCWLELQQQQARALPVVKHAYVECWG